MRASDRYPGIRRAGLVMSRCNGGINRLRTKEAVLRAMDRFLEQGNEDLAAISAWLLALSDEDLETVVDGEHEEQQALVAGAPPYTDALLCAYFDEVC